MHRNITDDVVRGSGKTVNSDLQLRRTDTSLIIYLKLHLLMGAQWYANRPPQQIHYIPPLKREKSLIDTLHQQVINTTHQKLLVCLDSWSKIRHIALSQ